MYVGDERRSSDAPASKARQVADWHDNVLWRRRPISSTSSLLCLAYFYGILMNTIEMAERRWVLRGQKIREDEKIEINQK
jgi:hypothetical protein